ncbi:ABC transporter permease [Paenibacillus sp. Marseille-Q4541]|uniref:ABC transporter permease n=1 Tax=Paenibacillus sp. Marseille-Q4541 TaxID=2831522 RepID=UPI0020193302|nr:ABC transporter permease [Paenibacillus sp. Marseille-Q4541]
MMKMSRIQAVYKRICKQMLRDKRTLAMLFVAPLVVLSLMFVLLGGEAAKPDLVISGVDQKLAELLSEQMNVTEMDAPPTKENLANEADGALYQKDGSYELLLVNENPTTSQRLAMFVKQAVQNYITQQQIPSGMNGGEHTPVLDQFLHTTYVYGQEDTDLFDVISPILLGFFAFLFVFLISGIGLLRERTTGTLERLLSTPIQRSEVVMGYVTGYGIFALLQTLIIVFFSIWVFDLQVIGSIWNVLLVNLLLALVALTLGLLLSTFASSEFQMIQFIPLAIIPQVFFTGIFPLDGMADWLLAIGHIMPMYYASHALKGIMYQGFSFTDIGIDVLILACFAALFILLNVWGLKKYRKL